MWCARIFDKYIRGLVDLGIRVVSHLISTNFNGIIFTDSRLLFCLFIYLDLGALLRPHPLFMSSTTSLWRGPESVQMAFSFSRQILQCWHPFTSFMHAEGRGCLLVRFTTKILQYFYVLCWLHVVSLLSSPLPQTCTKILTLGSISIGWFFYPVGKIKGDLYYMWYVFCPTK